MEMGQHRIPPRFARLTRQMQYPSIMIDTRCSKEGWGLGVRESNLGETNAQQHPYIGKPQTLHLLKVEKKKKKTELREKHLFWTQRRLSPCLSDVRWLVTANTAGEQVGRQMSEKRLSSTTFYRGLANEEKSDYHPHNWVICRLLPLRWRHRLRSYNWFSHDDPFPYTTNKTCT